MQHAAAPAPPAGRRAGGGQPTGPDRNYRGRAHGRGGRVAGDVLDPDPPAAVRGRPRHGDVPAEAGQHPAAKRGGDPGGRPVGGPRLGGGAQVEAGAHGQREGARRLVQVDLPPPGDLPDRKPHRRAVRWDQREVTVVTGCHHRPAHGRVHVPVRQRRRPQRDRDGLRQQRADPDRPGAARAQPGCPVQRHDLGVGPEPGCRRHPRRPGHPPAWCGPAQARPHG
jgi:hypothetical protein